MAYTKANQFSQAEVKLAQWAKALGHPARIAIIKFLAEKESCMCGDIVEHLPLAQSTVSQHLKELKKVGLIEGSIDGPRICYCLKGEVWTELKASLGQLFTLLASCKCCE